MKAVELTKSSIKRVVNYLIQYRAQTEVYTKNQSPHVKTSGWGNRGRTCQLASITGHLCLYSAPSFIWTFITTDQLTNNETLCGFHNLISLQNTDYKKTDGLLYIGYLFMTPLASEQNKRADHQ